MGDGSIKDELSSADRAQQYLDIAGVIIVAIGADERVQLINRKGCEVLGYPEEQIRGRKWFDGFIPEKDRQRTRSAFRQIVKGELEPVEYFRNQVVDSRGRVRVIDWHNAVLRDDDGQFVATLSSGEDVTQRVEAERRRTELEEQLRHSQKMEAIGSLAGGIAHDFNNLLNVIIGHADMMKEDERHGTVSTESIEEILSAAQRAAELTRHLLAFSRRQVLKPTVVNVNSVLQEMRSMMERVLGEAISFSLLTYPGLDNSRIDRVQFEQVIMNMAINARDAMPTGGSLTIATCNEQVGEDHHLVAHLPGPGPYVRVTITDTGQGMDAATRGRIFEPFFSTKGPEQGTGLGLSTAFGIIKQSGGHIEAISEPEWGTAMEILLPAADEPVTLKEASSGTQAQLEGTEVVLVVEDEPPVRRLVTSVLERHGYRTLTAADATEALALCKRHEGGIDLLLTDVVMPKVNGVELAGLVTGRYPHVKVIYMSGHTEEAVFLYGLLDGAVRFLHKPFTADELLASIRTALD